MGAPQFDDDGEQCWHEQGSDVAPWFVVGWIGVAVILFAAAGGLVLAL